MKKKTLFLLLVSLLVCLFAIGINAEVTVDDSFNVNRKTVFATAADLVKFSDGFTCPSAYIVKDQGTLEFDFNYLKTKTGTTYALNQVVELDIPEGITYLSAYALKGGNAPSLSKVSFPKTVTSMGNSVFEANKALTECVFEHTDESGLTKLYNWTFAQCTNLRAVSLPECIKELGNTEFRECTSLTALYLPRGLQKINSASGTSATFYGCTSMFFVEEPFTYDNVPTEAPRIYRFPSTLSSVSGEAFKNCTYLKNSVLVFPRGITTVDNGWRFANSNESNSQVRRKIVFLGKITEFAFSNECKYTDFYFVNSESTKNNVTFTNKGTPTSCNVYFCNGATYAALPNTNINTEGNWKTEEYAHLAGTIEITASATCTTNRFEKSVCFCGHNMGTEEIENSALGHDYREENKIYTFGSIYAQATSCMTCTRECGINSEAVDEGYVLADKGYSCCEYNNKVGILRAFDINKELLAEFEKVNGGVEIGFGITPYVEDAPPSILEDFVISEALKKENDEPLYSTINFIVTYGSDIYKDALIYIAGYAKVNGKIEFVDGAFNAISYNSIFELTK